MMMLTNKRKDLTKKFKDITKKYKIAKNSEKGILNKISHGNTSTLDKLEDAINTAVKEKINITVGSLNSIIKFKEPKIPVVKVDGISQYNTGKIDISKLPTITVNFHPYQIDEIKGKKHKKELGDFVIKFLVKDYFLKDGKEYVIGYGGDISYNKELVGNIFYLLSKSLPFDEDIYNRIRHWVLSKKFYLIVNIISKHKGITIVNKKPLTKRKVKGELLTLTNQYISYNSIDGKLLTNKCNRIEYVEKSKHKNSCLFDAIINKYYDLDKRYDIKLTYKKLFKICFPDLDYYDDIEIICSPEDVIPFFKQYSLGFHIIDITSNIESVYVPDNYNKHISPENLYILIHNDHAYEVNTNIKKLRDIKTGELEISNKYHISKGTDSINVNSYNELININFNESKSSFIKVDISKNLDKVFEKLIKDGYEPRIQFVGGRITGLYFYIKCKNSDKIILIQNSSYVENESNNIFNDKVDEFKKYDKLVYDSLINNFNKSKYCDKLIKLMRDTYQYPLTGRFIDDVDECDAYDICKAYPSCLLDIEKFPVFSSFDIPVEYDGHEIENYTFYLIKKKKFDINAYTKLKIIMDDEVAGMYGIAVKEIINNVEILLYCRPNKLVYNKTSIAIKELYKSGLEMQQIKDIMNKNIGKLGKLYNNKVETYVFNNEDEAHYFDMFFGRTRNIEISGKDYYIYTKDAKKQNLVDGFYPIYVLILDIMRIKMGKLFEECVNGGGEVIALHTDCIYTTGYEYGIEEVNKKNYYSIGKLFHSVNEVNIKKDIIAVEQGMINWSEYIVKKNIVEYELVDEYDINEFSQFLGMNNVLCLGDLPGVGKTTSLIKSCKANGWNILVICPYNNLASDIRKNHGVNAITLNKLCGYVEGMDMIKMNKFKSSDYNCFIFDEIYCYTISNLEIIKNFISSRKDAYHFASGDSYQLEPIGDSYKSDYQDMCIRSIFDNVLRLKVSKRFKNDDDVKKLLDIKKMLFVDSKKNIDVCKKYFKKSDVVGDGDISIAYKNETCGVVNEYVHKGEKYYKDLEVVCSKWLKGFHINETYVIKELGKKKVLLECGDEEFEITIKMLDKHFSYIYCRTAHSMQGLTADGDIHIFDVDFHYANITGNWLWVCITRAKSLDSIYYHC
jgi:uncharacterized protein (UPF0297 family)